MTSALVAQGATLDVATTAYLDGRQNRRDALVAAVRELKCARRHRNPDGALHKACLQLEGAIDRAAVLVSPRWQPSTKGAMKKQIAGATRAAAAMLGAIDLLQGPAIGSLEQRVDIERLRECLAGLVEHAVSDATRYESFLVQEKTNSPLTHARVIAACAGAVFEQYTGKRATVTTPPGGGPRTGPFVKFLASIFSIAEIRASAAAFALDAAKQRKTLPSG